MGTFTLKYPYLKWISWPLFKDAFLRVFKIGWCWMHIQAWIWWQGILLQSQCSLFLCILKPEAYAQKLDRSKTPAQLHIMNWHPDPYHTLYTLRRIPRTCEPAQCLLFREPMSHRSWSIVRWVCKSLFQYKDTSTYHIEYSYIMINISIAYYIIYICT